MHELPRDLDPALLSSRKVERTPFPEVAETVPRVPPLAASRSLGLRNPPLDALDVVVPLDGGEIERLTLLDDSDPAADLLAVVGRVHAEDPQRP